METYNFHWTYAILKRILRHVKFRHMASLLIVLLILSNITAWGTAKLYRHKYHVSCTDYCKVKYNLQETEKQLNSCKVITNNIENNMPGMIDRIEKKLEKNKIKGGIVYKEHEAK